MAKITGLGGIFFRSSDVQKLCAWYRDVLGLPLEEWGGAVLPLNPEHGHYQVWSVFPDNTTYLGPSTASFMVNFRVDDLASFLEVLKGRGAELIGEPQKNEHGSFAWVLDPDGNKIELWQP
jgi:catechol 2,3-dioxygenase-like lactoylglutathione lyase family enzyme